MGFNYSAVAKTVAGAQSSKNSLDEWLKMQQLQLQRDEQQRLMNEDMQRRKQQARMDSVANAVLATQNAPKATPVDAASLDPSDPMYNPAGGDVIDYTDGASPDSPLTNAQMAMHNMALGGDWNTSPKTPDMGGEAGLLAQMKAAQIGQTLARANKTNNPADVGMTENQRRTHDERDLKMKIALAGKPKLGGTRGGAAPAGPKPLFDSWQQLNRETQLRYGRDISEFRDTGPEDTRKEEGGLAYYMGGDKDRHGVTQPKQRVFVPQAEQDEFDQRSAALTAGNPRVLNQAAVDAGRLYQQALANRANPAASGGALPSGPASTPPTGSLFNGSAPAAGTDVLTAAKAAIAVGADPDKVKARLKDQGIDPTGL